MADINEIGRLAANVLIDAVSAYDTELSEQSKSEMMTLALERLSDVEAIGVSVDEGEEEVEIHVNLDNLVGGTIVSIHWLISELAEARGTSTEQVISQLREHLEA
ncbi:hypothetical protein [Glaciihabitans sp. dw_435]|uniref:hypothetical protein n=1 Tax=Glaciihabitans sp. dw_435 TaxID=2720081 RepID=UPI001BD68619|nr:hypothetical protein [Glaciihabitans sp. dw_435]